MAVKPILTEEVLANVTKKKKVQGNQDKNKAFLGFMRAKELLSNANKVKLTHLKRSRLLFLKRKSILEKS